MTAATPESDPALMQDVFDAQGSTALRWRTSTAAERIARLTRLREVILAHRESLYEAFHRDFRKPVTEVEGSEIIPILDELRHAIGHLARWMKPRRVRPSLLTLGNSAWVQSQPRGRCLVIAPWNYPLNLSVCPLISAIAAGNTVILKPSEMATHVSGVLARIIATVFKLDEVAVFEGGLPTAQALLSQPFDHLFFTGSPAVGKLVMAAAAKHLCSVTLELGGKSPTIVDETADVDQAAETILWGKLINAGQTCLAPDHLYVHEGVKARFLAACHRVLKARYGETARQRQNSPDLARIVNPRHTQRLQTLIDDGVRQGGTLLAGGEVDVPGCYVAPTLIEGLPPDAALMQEEIFGPIFPVIGYTDLDEVIAQVNRRPKPLALYIWTRDQARAHHVLNHTSSGGACVNHCIVHVAHSGLPFGGVNHSGMGSCHGHHGFKAFSHERSVLQGGWLNTIKVFFPPYTAPRHRLIRFIADRLG
jgi:aldehyde dehydrogenase (NAD+)